MQKRIAALLLALCLSLTCTLGALAEGPDDQELAQAVEEKVPEQKTDAIDGGAEEALSKSATVDDETETEQDTAAVKEQDDAVPAPTQADGETGQDAIAGEVQGDADENDENASQAGPDPQPTTTAETPQDPNAEWRQQTLAALAAANFSELWGNMTIRTNLEREVWYVGEPIVFIVSFEKQPWLSGNDTSVYQYLNRTLTEKTQMSLAITTLEDWYRDEQPILHTMYQGARPTNKGDVLQDFQFYGWAKSDYFFAFGCTPNQAGKYRLEVQSTVENSDDPMYPFISDTEGLKAAKMPGGSIEFTVVERPEVPPKVPAAKEGVALPEKAQQAVVEAFNNAANTDPKLDNAIRANAEKELTTELTITEAADHFAVPNGFDGTLQYKDIGIQVKADDKPIYTISQTLTPIGFAFEKPAGPIVLVWRKHDGEGVKRLPCWVDDGKVHFESDKFSTFAIGSTNNIGYAAVQAIGDQIYTGKEIEPAVTVTINGNETLVKGVDYDVEYEDQVEPGVATVKIVGKNDFTGTAYLYFNIVKPAPSVPAGSNGNTGSAPAAKDTAADEYIVCEACGHHNWERYLDGWRCTTCGHLRGTTGVPADAAAKAVQTKKTAYHGTIPQTADEFPLGGAVAVFGISLAGLAAVLLLRKKQR